MTIVPAIPGVCRDTIRQGCDRSGPSSGRIIPAAENDPNFQDPQGEFFEFFSVLLHKNSAAALSHKALMAQTLAASRRRYCARIHHAMPGGLGKLAYFVRAGEPTVLLCDFDGRIHRLCFDDVEAARGLRPLRERAV